MTGALILLVDDDVEIAEMYGLGMRSAGHQVRYAHDGQSAVRLALKEEPDLVLMDLHLPGTDGLGALRQLRSDPRGKSVRVVMFSNQNDDALVRTAQQLEASWVVKSTVTPRQLNERIEGWLGGFHRMKEVAG
jgi:DNA-binding response OmpR family regulator